MKRTLTLAWLLAAAACGGKDTGARVTAPPAAHDRHHAGSGGEHEGEHENLPPELKAFHELLSPRWHAAMGQQRIADTCGAIDQFKAAADAVAKATPPLATNADTWTRGTNALVAAVGDLETACTANNPGTFETAFAKVHDAFHVLMEQAQPPAE